MILTVTIQMKKRRAYGPNPSLHKVSHRIPDAQYPEGHLVTWGSLVTSPAVADADEGCFDWIGGCTRPLTFF